MRSEHTPAPWVWYEGDDAIESADGGVIAHVASHGNVNTIARTGETFSHANARLIARSPDMLAMLERVRRTCSLSEDDTLAGDIDALIAAARGVGDAG